MSDKPSAREFWIVTDPESYQYDDTEVYLKRPPQILFERANIEITRVIEYSAYEQALKERDQLSLTVQAISKNNLAMAEELGQLKARIEFIEARERLTEENLVMAHNQAIANGKAYAKARTALEKIAYGTLKDHQWSKIARETLEEIGK